MIKILKTSACAVAGLLALSMAAPAAAQTGREVWVQNSCPHPIRFVISHSDEYRNWHPHGWWNFSANQASTKLVVSDIAVMQKDDHDFYFYAESTDNSAKYWQGTQLTTYNGVQYKMMKASPQLDMGKFTVNITCP